MLFLSFKIESDISNLPLSTYKLLPLFAVLFINSTFSIITSDELIYTAPPFVSGSIAVAFVKVKFLIKTSDPFILNILDWFKALIVLPLPSIVIFLLFISIPFLISSTPMV